MFSWLARMGRLARSVCDDRRGSVYAFVGVALLPLLAAMGIAIDSARGYLVRARLSQALDAAALAGARVFTSATRDSDIRMYFAANFANSQYSATLNPSPAPSIAAGTLTLTASATIPTTFMRVVGFNTLTVQAQSQATRQDRGMELALVMDNTGSMSQDNKMTLMQQAAANLLGILYGNADTVTNLNVGVVPFVTMVNVGAQYTNWIQPSVDRRVAISSITRTQNSPLVTVATATPHGFATGDFVNITGVSVGHGNNPYNIYAYIWTNTPPAPNSTTFYYRVDPGGNPNRTPTVTGAFATRPGAYPTGTSWNGCTVERSPPYDTAHADAAPTTQLFQPYFWQSTMLNSTTSLSFFDQNGNAFGLTNWIRPNSWYNGHVNMGDVYGNNAYSPNIGCMVPAVLPLQPSRSVAQNLINTMQPVYYGGTMTPVGLAWRWRILSPNYRGLWGSPSSNTLPGDYDPTNTDKVIVFLTDGFNEWDSYSPNLTCQSQAICSHAGINGNSGASTTNQYYAEYAAFGRMEAGRMNGVTTYGGAYTELNNRVTSLCNTMKAQGVIIFTILLETNDVTTENLYQNCASQAGYYFNSPSSSQLAGIFTQIGNELRRLRLSR